MSGDLEAALAELGRIEGDFQDSERLYFLGRATVEQLRAAWDARDRARRRVAELHGGSGQEAV